MSCFSFYLFHFSPTKSENRKVEQVLLEGRLTPVGAGGVGRKRVGK
jgi:hypothetical protein